MKIRLLLAVILLTGALCAVSASTDFNWPGRGVISFTVPPNWTMQARPATEAGYYFVATTQSRNQAIMQITLMETPPEKPADPEALMEFLEAGARVYLPTSVEKKVVPRGMLLAQGKGYWTEFTDGRLVGKPPVPRDYKVTRSAIIALDEHALVVATMQFDNPKSNEPGAMLGILSSMRLKRGPTEGPATSTLGPPPLVFAVPGNQVMVNMNALGMDRETFSPDIRSEDSGYFIVMRKEPNLNLSGWLEPAAKYPGIRKLWEQDSAGMASGGTPEPEGVAFGREGEWEILTYTHTFGDTINCHLRAQLIKSGTWIDLHLSSMSNEAPDAALGRLRSELRKIKVNAL